MKILHLLLYYAPVGGTEKYVLDVMSHLERAGHQNFVVYLRPDEQTVQELPWAAYPVFAGPGRKMRLEEVLEKEEPDLAYLHSLHSPRLVTWLAGQLPSVAFVHDFHTQCPGQGKYFRRPHGICRRQAGWGCVPYIYLRDCARARDPNIVTYNIKRILKRLEALRQIPRVLAASSYMQGLLVQNGIEESCIQKLPLYADFSESDETYWPENPNKILFVGRLTHEKGLQVLLRSIGKIKQPFELLVAGDGPLREECERLAQSLGIRERVQFLGWLDHAQLAKTYAEAFLVALPSIWPEPFGKAGIDALSFGRPVIAFDAGGISDWLQDGYSGYLVPVGNESLMAQRIDELLAAPEKARIMGENGCKDVQARFLPGHHVMKLEAVFNAAMEAFGEVT